MGFYTIDDYYSVEFYNETKEALKNNNIEFKEYISSKAPYSFYFETKEKPVYLNYDESDKTYSKWLVNIVKALKPNDDYLYFRRASFTNIDAIKYYCINDALKSGQDSGEGIFFTATKEEVLRISKDYPRKIFFMGRYYNRKYKIFFTDNLIIKNLLSSDQILVESDNFNIITELEVKLNFNIFKLKDRLEKISQTPYILKNKFYTVGSVRPDLKDTYILT